MSDHEGYSAPPTLAELWSNEPQRIELAQKLLGRAGCQQMGIYPLPDDFVLSVVIPIYNERETLEEILRRVRETGIRTQIILVDDGSTDGTRDLLESVGGRRQT